MIVTTLSAIAALLCSPAGANGFRSMAGELALGAKRARIERVAVLPFVPADGNSSRDGWMISERFVTQLVRTGRIQAVERSLLDQVIKEHRLDESGLVDPAAIKRIGKLFAVDGVVTGSFVQSGARLLIDARIIDVETGLIVAACEEQVDRDWFSSAVDEGSSERIVVPAPEFFVEAPKIGDPDELELKDSLNEGPCAGASERVDELERRVLDLKARYWALRLKKGLVAGSLRANPGSDITNLSLKHDFYEKLADWSSRPDIPELSPREVQRFVAMDGKAYALAQRCGI